MHRPEATCSRTLITIGDLRRTPCLVRLLHALDRGQDIDEHGLKTFVRIAYHFISEAKMLEVLLRQPGMDELRARQLLEHTLREAAESPTCADIQDGQCISLCDYRAAGGCGLHLHTALPFPGVHAHPGAALTSSRYIVALPLASQN